MAAASIRHYLLEQMGPAADGRAYQLYGQKLTRAISRRRKLAQLKPLAQLYGRLYDWATPLDADVHPTTGQPCSVDQKAEAIDDWLQS